MCEINLLDNVIKNMAQTKAKIIDDYMKFWFCVKTDIDKLTAEELVNNYMLAEIQPEYNNHNIKQSFMMTPKTHSLIHTIELERLKEVEEKYKKLLREYFK